MNAPKLSQLLLMQRAYRAVEPNVAEVQAGVRRARLALRQPRRTRTGRAKPLLLLVLGLSGMAYAYPSALRELTEPAAPALPHDRRGPSRGAGARPAPVVEQQAKQAAVSATLSPGTSAAATPAALTTPAADAAPPLAATAPSERPASAGDAPSVQEQAPKAELPAGSVRPVSAAAVGSARTQAAGVTDTAARAGGAGVATGGRGATASQWGSVRRALAHGNEQAALAALSSLARSIDPQTRDKAKLGRAQLLMARGEHTQACSLARELSEHCSDPRIERQAQGLLKSCTR